MLLTCICIEFLHTYNNTVCYRLQTAARESNIPYIPKDRRKKSHFSSRGSYRTRTSDYGYLSTLLLFFVYLDFVNTTRSNCYEQSVLRSVSLLPSVGGPVYVESSFDIRKSYYTIQFLCPETWYFGEKRKKN